MPTAQSDSIVFVVDDDASIRDAVKSLLKSVGLRAEVFGSTEEFVSATRPQVPSCLVLDVRLPGLSGLEFQEELERTGIRIPIIFVTAHGDIPMTSRAMKAGAIEFLPKLFQKQELLEAIHQALERDRMIREEDAGLSTLRLRFDSLTDREREVRKLMELGLPDKLIAEQLVLSVKTIEKHAGAVLRKTGARNRTELAALAGRARAR